MKKKKNTKTSNKNKGVSILFGGRASTMMVQIRNFNSQFISVVEPEPEPEP